MNPARVADASTAATSCCWERTMEVSHAWHNEFDVLCRFRSSQAGRQTRTVGKGMRTLVRRCS